MKNLTFKDIPEDLFYRALEQKRKLHANNWQEFLEKVLDILEEKNKVKR